MYLHTYNIYERLNAFLHMCHEPSLLIYRRELGLISRKYYRLWQHPVFSVVVVGRECGVPITKRSYSFYKQSLYDGDQFVIMAVITKNNTANTRIHLYRQPATETWRWITAQLGTGKPQLIGVHYGINTLQCNTMVSYRLKKAAPKPPLFSRPCGQLVGLTPIFGSWFGLAALDSLSSFLWSSWSSLSSPRSVVPFVTRIC